MFPCLKTAGTITKMTGHSKVTQHRNPEVGLDAAGNEGFHELVVCREICIRHLGLDQTHRSINPHTYIPL